MVKNTLALSELCKVLCLVKEINNIILPLGMVEKMNSEQWMHRIHCWRHCSGESTELLSMVS